MSQSPKPESAIEWLAKSMGFMDKVCCYSYSDKNVYEDDDDTFQIDMRSDFVPSSWSMNEADDDMDDLVNNSIVYHQQSSLSARYSKTGHPRDRRCQQNGQHWLGKENISTRSVETRSTATTSSTTTVVTSGRVRAASGDSTIASASQQSRRIPQYIQSTPTNHSSYRTERHQPTPTKIYCHSYSDGELYASVPLKPVQSRSFQGVSFTSATEGYPC